MTTRSMKIGTTLFVVVVLSMGLVALNGCKKSETASPEPSAEVAHDHDHEHEGHEHMAMKAEPAAETVSTIEQTTCPIMAEADQSNC